MKAWRGALLGAALLLAAAAPAAAQRAPAGDVARGRVLAESLCARCHVVAREARPGWTDAPSFPTIAADRKVTRSWLEGFFTRPHLNMLFTDRPPQEAADLAAYILSLRGR